MQSYRQLLPMPSQGAGSSQEPPKRPKKTPGRLKPNILQACDTCRKRKTRCDGQQPCSGCASKNDECVYSSQEKETRSRTIEREHEELVGFYEYLRTMPYAEALEMFHRLRATDSASSMLSLITEGALLLQLSSPQNSPQNQAGAPG